MKIGILETGQLPEELSGRHGDYPDMFKRLLRTAAPDLEFAVYRITEGEMPQAVRECDGWLVTGSKHGVYDDLPWIEPLKTFLRQAYAAHVPVVGICFGHQILAEALGGKAEKSEKGWGLGVHRYRVERKPQWMTGIGGELRLLALHQDQVTRPPADAEVLAGSEFCPYGILAYPGNAMSIQLHPEYMAPFYRELIDLRRRTGAFSENDAEAALDTLDAPADSTPVAQWILQFMQGCLREHRATA